MLLINEIRRQNHGLAADIQSAIARVLDRGWYILGPEVEAFENEFAEYCSVEHCIGVANGTDALELALRALDLPVRSRVLTVANAGGYSSTAILAAGLTPVYADIDPVAMTMQPVRVADVRAVIATHLYGRMAAMPAILAAAGTVPVIEDCAQAHGAMLGGRKAGSWGTIGCFSFYPTKNLGALGDGGAGVTDDPAVADAARLLRSHGERERHVAVVRGSTSRLDALQAAVLSVKLRHLERWNERRRELAHAYRERLGGMAVEMLAPDSGSAQHLFVVCVPERDGVRAALHERGVEALVHYPRPVHRQPAYADLAPSGRSLATSERLCAEVLSLPLYPYLGDDELAAVCDALTAEVAPDPVPA